MRSIRQGDLERVSDVLGRAFDDDPYVNFLVAGDARRSERVRRMLALTLRRLTFPFGETYVADGFEGAALWNPPGRRLSSLRESLRLVPEVARATGWRRFARALAVLEMVDLRHPREAHYYLQAIGVDPPHQGRGVGSSLLAPMVERFDREGVPAYLESSKERNLPLYERFGFRVTKRMDLPWGGPPLWLMWRDPQQA